MTYDIEFFNSLNESEQTTILTAALKQMRKRKVTQFQSDGEVKAYLWLLERLEKQVNGEDYGGYDCDIVGCRNPAHFYNSNIGAFYCMEHN